MHLSDDQQELTVDDDSDSGSSSTMPLNPNIHAATPRDVGFRASAG